MTFFPPSSVQGEGGFRQITPCRSDLVSFEMFLLRHDGVLKKQIKDEQDGAREGGYFCFVFTDRSTNLLLSGLCR